MAPKVVPHEMSKDEGQSSHLAILSALQQKNSELEERNRELVRRNLELSSHKANWEGVSNALAQLLPNSGEVLATNINPFGENSEVKGVIIENKKLTEKLSRLIDERDFLAEDVIKSSQIRDQYNQLEKRNEEIAKNLTKLRADLEAKRKKLADLEKNRGVSKSEHVEEKEALQSRLSNLRSISDQLIKQKSELQSRNDELKRTNQTLSNQLTDVLSEIDSFKLKVRKEPILHPKIADPISENSFNMRLRSLTAQSRERFESKLAALDRRIDQISSRINLKPSSRIEELQAQVDELLENDANPKLASMLRRVKVLEEENRLLSGQIREKSRN